MITKALIGRDPRNPAHVKAAMEIIQGSGGMRISPSAQAELRHLGLAPPNVKVRRTVRPDDVLLGGFFFLQEGINFADNVIRPCETCRTPLQYRPTLGFSPQRKLCLFCAADLLSTSQTVKPTGKPAKLSTNP